MRQGCLLLTHPGNWDNSLSPNVNFESCKSLEKKRLEKIQVCSPEFCPEQNSLVGNVSFH